MTKSIPAVLAAILLISSAQLAVVAAQAASEAGTTVPKITEAYAKKQITGDNYTDVTDVVQIAGGWTAKAKEGGKPVSLIVDNFGGVQKQ